MRRLALAALTLLLARPAAADPRWWWDDVRLTNTPTDSITPHVITPGYASGGLVNAMYVTWAEVDPAQGDLEIWMTASFDGGCSFCDSIRITDNAVDDTNPRIAILVTPEGFWSLALAFESEGAVRIAWDSTHANARVMPDQRCAELAHLSSAIITGDQYIHFGDAADLADHPDIVQVTGPNWAHFHAVWRELSAATGSRIFAARDLTARGGVGWSMTPPKELQGAASPVLSQWEQPVLAGDVLISPDPVSGMPRTMQTSVNVAFLESVEVGPTYRNSVVATRSIDSGTTFSANGDMADGPASVVSVPVAGNEGPRRPGIAASGSNFDLTGPLWVATAWDTSGGGGAPALLADARRLETPAAPNPDWEATDETLCARRDPDDGRPAVALRHAFGTDPTPGFVAWQDLRSGTREVLSRGALFDAAAPDPTGWDRYPIPAARALDPVASVDTQLSSCLFDEATFDCPTSRTAGDAREPSISSNEQSFFVAWSDSRDGNREIYFKRTDTQLFMGAPRLTAGCAADGTAYVDVVWDRIATCGNQGATEKMRRYLVYWGTNPGGPYDNAASPLVVVHDATTPPLVTARIAGLTPGTTYQVIVVPEDEARNVSPADFDPTRDGATPPFNEGSIVTPAPCVAATCLWRSDVTALAPFTPPRSAVFLVPPTPDDIHLQGPSYQCPFATGDLEPDANAGTNGVPLVLYQVNEAVGSLRLAKSGTTLRFTW